MGTIVGSTIILIEAAVAIATLSSVPALLSYGVCCAFKRNQG